MKTKDIHLKSKSPIVVLIVLFLFSGLFACSDDNNDNTDMESTQKISYAGTFVKSSDNVTTSATGTAKGTFDPITQKLTYTISWSGLGSNAVNMHFHNDGPVIVEITGFANATAGTVSGTATLTNQQVNDLAAGKIYAQIHTQDYPAGEVLATLTKDNSGSNNSGGGSGY
ncbi:CHRD domain-containing protein [Sunxiuqinia sp. sy24]|uniref:CHRD domain-containing protein n=1 Tax=Sunxiuqinia sp. sy24 TaxID=3461495 RepID=UPI00404672CE